MAEWSIDKYTIHLGEDVSAQAMYGITSLLSGYLAEESFQEHDGCPLGILMNELGFKGDRDGLVETSRVRNIWTTGDSISFDVHDNFSEFDVCRSLANHLNRDFSVDVKYGFSEGAYGEFWSDEMHFECYAKQHLAELLKEKIAQSLDEFAVPGGTVDFHIYYPLDSMAIAAIGPGEDEIRLARRGNLLEGDEDFITLKVDDIKSPFVLENLINAVTCNATETAKYMDEHFLMEEGFDVSEDEPGKETDMVREREMILERLYGSSVAYQNVSEFMEGYDVEHFQQEIILEPTCEEAIEWAKHVPVQGRGYVDLSEEVRKDLDNGLSPSESFREWDIDPFPGRVIPEKMVLLYGGEPVFGFSKCDPEMTDDGVFPFERHPVPDTVDIWKLEFRNKELERVCRDRSGDNLEGLMGLNEAEGYISGGRLIKVIGHVMESQQNRKLVQEAVNKTSRKIRQKKAYESFRQSSSHEIKIK